jgi:hypothetical protein
MGSSHKRAHTASVRAGLGCRGAEPSLARPRTQASGSEQAGMLRALEELVLEANLHSRQSLLHVFQAPSWGRCPGCAGIREAPKVGVLGVPQTAALSGPARKLPALSAPAAPGVWLPAVPV